MPHTMPSGESERLVRIVNDSGLHARPCHAVVTAALEFEAELRISCRGREVNGKSILELMTLNAGKDTELALKARGVDCEPLLECLDALFASGFEERP